MDTVSQMKECDQHLRKLRHSKEAVRPCDTKEVKSFQGLENFLK